MFGAAYTVAYATLAIRASMKYGKTKELFNMTNAKLILLSAILLYPLGLNVQILQQKHERMQILLSVNSTACANPDSPMCMFSQLYTQSFDLLCTKSCPCSGNPMMFKEDHNVEIIDVSNEA